MALIRTEEIRVSDHSKPFISPSGRARSLPARLRLFEARGTSCEPTYPLLHPTYTHPETASQLPNDFIVGQPTHFSTHPIP
ncbi:hypothetical protein RRG08_065198 [Elysia crispata]|uniref:Uncharacterized protein n=1 Tax=Elysia crispata TaxID=231223 RepID=A0AAE0YQU6_9GAST|nr:hypothetical protein RRG08_065198 [Elysia crispata]